MAFRQLYQASIFLMSFAVSATAGEVFAPEGQPMCEEQDKLKEMLLAMLQKDIKWMKSLDGCILLKRRSKFAVIEQYEGSEIAHVVKGRVFGPRSSFVVYTLNIGLEGLEASQ